MPQFEMNIFPGIQQDAAGEKRTIHDVLNLKPRPGRTGIAPIKGNEITHHVTITGTGVKVFWADPTLFGATEGFILGSIDTQDVGQYNTTSGRILSLFYYKDPLDRLRDLFTGSFPGPSPELFYFAHSQDGFS